MHVVRHAHQAVALAAAGMLAAGVLAGCGGGSSSGAAPGSSKAAARTPTVVNVDLGVDYRLANCRDWKRGSEAQRRGTVEEIAGFAGGPVGNDNGQGNTLAPDQAYTLFENWCAQPVARAFKLYKLYTRAAAFTPPQR